MKCTEIPDVKCKNDVLVSLHVTGSDKVFIYGGSLLM